MSKVGYPNFKFSFFKGFRFKFTVDDKDIFFLVSAWNGKEKVIYNSEIISEIQSYTLISSHVFLINDVEYKIFFITESLLKGKWQCHLLKEERKIQSYLVYFKEDNFLKKLLFGIAGGLLLLFTPKTLWIICIPFLILIIFIIIFNNLVCEQNIHN